MTTQTNSTSFLEKTFKLRENKTTVKTEVLAGFTTFMTMAYIIIVNPLTLAAAGMDPKALFTATCVSAGFATILMAFLANYPFALAPGMGLNAFFAYSVVIAMGYSWQLALTAVFAEGIIFIIMSFFKVREAILDAIPISLKYAISAGIGLFIAFLGFVNAGIVKAGGAILTLGDVKSPTAVVALAGIIITAVLLQRNVKGALFFGILLTTVVGLFNGVTQLPKGFMELPPSLAPIAMAPLSVSWTQILTWDFLIVVLSFLFVDVFDTVGTVIGVGSKANMLDKDGKLPRSSQVLLTDAIGTTAGALMGTSTVTTFVESAAGVAEGGRTGLTSLTTGTLFLIALFFSPLFLIVPAAATSPALIIVGLFMIEPITKIDLHDLTQALPAFLTIIVMPITYSIADGIVAGVISYTLINLVAKIFDKASNKKTAQHVSWTMIILTVLFMVKFSL